MMQSREVLAFITGTCLGALAAQATEPDKDYGEPYALAGNRMVFTTWAHVRPGEFVAGGEVRIALLTADGDPIPACQPQDCVPVATNATLQPVRWAEARDLSAWSGRPVRLRFHVTRAKLYSFWVSPDESGASYGYVAAGGPGFTEPRDTVGRAALEAARPAQQVR